MEHEGFLLFTLVLAWIGGYSLGTMISDIKKATPYTQYILVDFHSLFNSNSLEKRALMWAQNTNKSKLEYYKIHYFNQTVDLKYMTKLLYFQIKGYHLIFLNEHPEDLRCYAQALLSMINLHGELLMNTGVFTTHNLKHTLKGALKDCKVIATMSKNIVWQAISKEANLKVL